MNTEESIKKGRILFAVFSISLIAIVVVGFKASRPVTWPVIVVLMAVMFMSIGWSIKGRLLGVLINERRSMSLSRFQMVLWTLIVLSAYSAIALLRARAGQGVGALDITVPAQIWALMGINSAALVGSPLIATNKTKKVAVDASLKERDKMGILSVKAHDDMASFTDLFRGDEVKSWDYIDMPRLQMFFFTIIVAIVYCVDIYRLVSEGNLSKSISLPAINEGMVTLMGISNAAYLGGKSIDQTPAKSK